MVNLKLLGAFLTVAALAYLSSSGEAMQSADSCYRSAASTSKNCFLLSALNRLLVIPTRYVVTREKQQGCVTLTAPAPPRGHELGTEEYAKRIKSESGLIRYCDREVLDRDVREIEAKFGLGKVKTDDGISVQVWDSDLMRSRFTTTYFASKDEGLLIYDVDPEFAVIVWRAAIKE